MSYHLLSIAALALASCAAAPGQVGGDGLHIAATIGGYTLRTVSPRGDRIVLACQDLNENGRWTLGMEVHAAGGAARGTGASPTLSIVQSPDLYAYPLTPRTGGDYVWSSPDQPSFVKLLDRLGAMTLDDAFVSPELGIAFNRHLSNDPATIAAFRQLCRLPTGAQARSRPAESRTSRGAGSR
jgi:hypothetical protein